MKHKSVFISLMCMGLLVLGLQVPAFAEQATVKATAPWKGEGFAFPIGENRVYMVAVFSGILFVEDSRGPCTRGRWSVRPPWKPTFKP